MKAFSTRQIFFLLFLIAFSFTFSDCTDRCEETYTYVYYEPVYSTSEELKAAVGLEPARPMNDIGRIYFKDGFLFINESGEGIHIIDNRDPKNPLPVSFLKIPGNFDLAIRGNILYADSYVDLVAFDVSNLHNIKEVARIERLFNNHRTMGMLMATDKGILTGWEKKERVTVSETRCGILYHQTWGGIFYRGGIALQADAAGSFSNKAAIAPGGSQTGVGGSMARFTISGNHLYGLDGANMDIVDVSNVVPVAKNEMPLSWDAETLFPYKDKLFVGSRTGMYILDLAKPVQPEWISTYTHVRSCDPVVVEGNYAYVTLRSGTACQGFTNQLEVIDISNLKAPWLVATYPMTNPHGLGIDQGTLFICDGNDGLKVYPVNDVRTITANRLAHYKNINAFDVIPFEKVAMMIGSDGLYQYDYSDINNIKLISQLPIVKK